MDKSHKIGASGVKLDFASDDEAIAAAEAVASWLAAYDLPTGTVLCITDDAGEVVARLPVLRRHA